VALARQIYGNEHPVVADYLTLLGRALTFRMDDESIPVTREALRIRRGLFDEQSPEVAWAKTCVCFALWHGDGTRDLAEAERLAYEALAVQRPLRDTHGVDLAISLHTVAALHTFQGQPERALPVWREAIAVYRALPEFVDRYLAECIRGCALTAGYLDYGDEEVSLLREYNTLTPEAFVTDRGPRRGLWRLASVLSQRAADATGADAEALRREACDVAIRSLRGECRSLAADLPDRAGTLQRTEAALAASPGLDSVVEIVAELLGLISGDAGTGLPFRFEHAAFFADFLGDTGNGAMAIEPLQRLADTYKAVGDLQHAEACRALPSAAAKATYWTRP
jgi:hypothetical protein